MKKTAAGIFLLIIMCVMTVSGLKVHASTSSTWIVDAQGDGAFSSIQAALNHVNSGDTVYVKSGIYFEHVTISKTVSLIGENRETTTIDAEGKDPGSIIVVAASNVKIAGFTIQNSREGGNAICIDGFNQSTVSDNVVATKNGDGIRVLRSFGNVISDNLVTNNSYTSVGFDWTFDNSFFNNTITNNRIGIGASYDAYRNVFHNNTIVGNNHGILVAMHDSKFFHNIIANSTVQAFVYFNLTNKWDNGYPSGGNYWSDYDKAGLMDEDIGERPYVINDYNKDDYPILNVAYLERLVSSTSSSDINYSIWVPMLAIVIGAILVICGYIWLRKRDY